MKKVDSKTKYVTEKHLDKRLTEQTQVILSAMDSILVKRLAETEEKMRIDINNVQTLIDGYVKSQEDFKEEFLIMKEELAQIKKVLKKKLGLEIKAA